MQMDQAPHTPEFIAKLYQMIQNFPKIISFSRNGKEILIHSYRKFVTILLPRYFRHRNWKSFVRQMNMYGFKKLDRGLDIYMFYNDIFWEGNQENFHQIKRKQLIKEAPNMERQKLETVVSRGFKEEYDAISSSQFIYQIFSFVTKTEQTYREIKRKLDFIKKVKKGPNTVGSASKVKESIQTISETARKLKEIGQQHMQHYEQIGFATSTLSSMPCSNQAISGQIKTAPPNNFIDDQKNEKKEQSKTENKLEISKYCSFNSVTHLIDL